MKAILLTLSIFVGSLIAEPMIAEAATSTTYSSFGKNPFVNQSSAKRFKKSRRRGAKTCLKKGGCNGKTKGLFKKKRGSCNSYL